MSMIHIEGLSKSFGENLVFQNRNKSRTLFFVLPRDRRFDAKAFAKALDMAVARDPRITDVLSTKGSL